MTDYDKDAREFRAELVTAFEAAGAAADSFSLRGARISRVMAEWSSAAGTLRSRFTELSDVLGSTFAAALEPAVQALNRFMAAVLRVARTFRSFVYSLFGKTADAAQTGADAWDDLGSSASGAGKRVSAAAKEVRRSLMGFDQIQRLDWVSSSSGSGSSGIGSLASALMDWSDFVPANAFGELLHSLIEDSRYEEAGQALASKLGELVDELDAALTDETFQAKIGTKLRSLTELVNGYLAGITFTQEDTLSVAGRIGDFFGDAVGLALESAHELLSGLDWDKLGTSIAQFVNGAVQSLREKDANIGTVASDWLNARLGALDGLFSTLDWSGAGAYVSENVNAWFENVDWTLVGATLRDGILGLKDFVTTALAGIDVDWHTVVMSLLDGLLSEDTKQWFNNHPFWSKLLFGDENPFTVTLGGVTDRIPETQKVLLGFSARLSSWKEALSGKVINFQANFTTWKDSLKNKFVTGFSAAVSAWSDKIAAGKKWISGFGANVSRWWDGLKSSSKWISGFGATVTRWWDSLKSSSKWISGFGATISKWWNSLTGKWLHFSAEGGVYKSGRWAPIQRYAAGGSPDSGQLFMAREAGPELVGTLGGHTAVMNNDQIVASVSAGVARAIAGIRFYSQDRYTPQLAVVGQSVSRSEQRLAAMEQQQTAAVGSAGQLLDALLQVVGLLRDLDTNVYMDGEKVTGDIISRINRTTQATGRCPILV